MQLVINISEEMYKWVNDANKIFNDYGMSDFINLVKKGTPIPKGCGRLVDADAIYGQIGKMIDSTPTIIKEDWGNK